MSVHNYVLKWAQYFSEYCNVEEIWINQEMLLFSTSNICIFRAANSVVIYLSPPLVLPDCSGGRVRFSRSFFLPLVLFQYLHLQVATVSGIERVIWNLKSGLAI